MKISENISAPQKAWVAFSGQTDLPWLKILKPGFRHCFVLLNDGQSWLTLDPLSNNIELAVHHHLPPDFDLPRWLESQGLRIVETVIAKQPGPAPFMLFTCVEAVKRVLGLRGRFIFTPWQLYRRLVRDKLGNYHDIKGELSWEV